MDFDPNGKPSSLVYATYIPTRRPNFKAYANKGHASASLSYAGYGIFYKFVDGSWVEIFRVEKPTACDLCGTPGAHFYELYGHPARPTFLIPRVCEDCLDSTRGSRNSVPARQPQFAPGFGPGDMT